MEAVSGKLKADTQGLIAPLSNILCFWRSSRASEVSEAMVQEQLSEVSESSKVSETMSGMLETMQASVGNGATLQLLASVPAARMLLRVVVALFRLLPYAIRSQLGIYRYLEPKNKRKRTAGKDTVISRHCLENLLGMGIRPSRLSTYLQALTHPSAVIDRTDSFERLELLGDGVLTLIARELLLERLPTANEGMITIQTSALVSNECISSVAQWLGIGKYVRGHCIDADNSRGILCDSFEALVGAVYTDKGLEGAREFITRILDSCPFAELDSMSLERNYVSDLKCLVRNKGCPGAFRRRLRMTRTIVSKKHANKNDKRTALPRTRYRVEIRDEKTEEIVGVGESYTVVIAEQYAAKEFVEVLEGVQEGVVGDT